MKELVASFRCMPTTKLKSSPPLQATLSPLLDSRKLQPEKPCVIEKMEFPEPVVKVAVEPKRKGDQQKLSEALIRLLLKIPSFWFFRDKETVQTVIEGMGELLLEIIVDRMDREFGVQCNVGKPQVS